MFVDQTVKESNCTHVLVHVHLITTRSSKSARTSLQTDDTPLCLPFQIPFIVKRIRLDMFNINIWEISECILEFLCCINLI